jgi:hypothetical protein
MALVLIAIVLGLGIREALVLSATPPKSRTPISLCCVGIPLSALAIQALVAGRMPAEVRPFLSVTTTSAIIGWLLINAFRNAVLSRRLAFVTIALGTALNLALIVRFGAMPVDPAALAAAGFSHTYDVASGHLSKHLAFTHQDMPFLGDRFGIAWLRSVASIGDFVELAGIALLVSTHPKRATVHSGVELLR